RGAEADDGSEAPLSGDEEAIELDFDLEVDFPTAEIHLDHPTTELELNPEALEAFQEALQHSTEPGSHEDALPPDRAHQDASREVADDSATADLQAHAAADDAETSFAGVLDDTDADADADA